MPLTGLDIAFWVMGFLGEVCLMAVLITKKRYRTFPWFTVLIAGEMIQTLVLVGVHAYGSHRQYFYTYWTFEVIEAFIRIAVLVELTKNILRQLDRDDTPFLREFVLSSCALLALAGLAIWRFTPDLQNPLTNAAFKITVFSGVLLLGLAGVTFLTVFFYGVRFRVHAAVLTYGLIIYSAGKFLVFAAVFDLRSPDWWSLCEKTLKPLYILCLFTWSLL